MSFRPFLVISTEGRNLVLLSFRTPTMSFRTHVRNLVFKGSRFLTRLRRFGMTIFTLLRNDTGVYVIPTLPFLVISPEGRNLVLLSFRPPTMSFRTYVRNLVFKGSRFLTRLRRFGMTIFTLLRNDTKWLKDFSSLRSFEMTRVCMSFRPFLVISTLPCHFDRREKSCPFVIPPVHHVISNACEKSCPSCPSTPL
jgi:hypothetical protein